MFSILRAACVLAALTAAYGMPAAAASVTNFSGIASSGFDGDGDSLAGQAFHLRIVTDAPMHGDVDYNRTDLFSDNVSVHASIGGRGYGAIGGIDTSFGELRAYSETGYSGLSVTAARWVGDRTFNASAALSSGFYDLGTDVVWGRYLTGPADSSAVTFSLSDITWGTVSFTTLGSPVTVWSGGTSAVPEPEAWALLIAGFGLAGAALRRRRVSSYTEVV